MASYTDIYRANRTWIAIVTFRGDGWHRPINGEQHFPTKETWHEHGVEFKPNRFYAAFQYFEDHCRDVNDYVVLSVKDITLHQGGIWLYEDFAHLSRSLFLQGARRADRNIQALDDPEFIQHLLRLQLMSEEQAQELQLAKATQQVKEKKTTLVF